MKLKMVAAALSILSLNAFASDNRATEPDKGWIIPNSDTYIGYQSDNWSCGAYSATKFLNAFAHGVGYSEFKNHYSQKIWGGGGGNVYDTNDNIGMSPNRLAQGINFYVAERVASRIKNGTLVTEDIKAKVWRDYSTESIKREVWNNDRPVVVLLKTENGILHWVTVVGWRSSTNSPIYADTDGQLYIASFHEFDNMRLNDYSFSASGIYPNTVITGSKVQFNTVDAMFDALVSGSEHLIYKVPVLSELYNLNKLGGETMNSVLGFGVNGINNTLSNLGIHGFVPDLTVPLSLSDIVRIKDDAKKVASNVGAEANRVADNVAAHPGYQHVEQTVNRANNEVKRWFGWRKRK